MIVVDFETRSRCDLKKFGAYQYARDPSTEVICCAFANPNGDERWVWRNPDIFHCDDQIFPRWVAGALTNPGQLVAAHNAQFDRLIWEYVAEAEYMFPEVAFERWYCTSALCRVNALPGALDDAIRAITTKVRKDFRGKALIKQLSIPNEFGGFNEDGGLLEEMVEYCMQDVEVVVRLLAECRPLTQREHQEWLDNEEINERGVRVDTRLANFATNYASREAVEIQNRLSELTNGTITKHTQTARIRDYVHEHLVECASTDAPMVRYKNGKRKLSIDKAARAELMGRADELQLPADVREVIELTDEGNRSSVAKFRKMLELSDVEDNRVRGAFVYGGASQTLRFASRGLQLHNMRRDCLGAIEIEALLYQMQQDYAIDNVMDTLSRALRPTLIPDEGFVFVVGDWSAIEAMGLPWLSASAGGERVLNLFRENQDIYTHTARELGINDRQIGKVATLSLGFGGAVGAFQAMARAYGVVIDDHRAQMIVDRWRVNNPWATQFWNALHTAAVRAVNNPKHVYTAGRVEYSFVRDVLGGTLFCFMPGDTVIMYPQCRLETVEGRYGARRELTALKAGWTAAADADHWPRHALWHGLLAENVTQAFCARILREALHRLEVEDGPGDVVMHVHDEIVLEVDADLAYAAKDRLGEVMNVPPKWAKGLPLTADPEIKARYGK